MSARARVSVRPPLSLRAQNEIAMMRTSRHANVVEYLESYMFERSLWVVMEYMDAGSLTNLLQARPRITPSSPPPLPDS